MTSPPGSARAELWMATPTIFSAIPFLLEDSEKPGGGSEGTWPTEPNESSRTSLRTCYLHSAVLLQRGEVRGDSCGAVTNAPPNRKVGYALQRRQVLRG